MHTKFSTSLTGLREPTLAEDGVNWASELRQRLDGEFFLVEELGGHVEILDLTPTHPHNQLNRAQTILNI
jgi:hypothetical protein